MCVCVSSNVKHTNISNILTPFLVHNWSLDTFFIRIKANLIIAGFQSVPRQSAGDFWSSTRENDAAHFSAMNYDRFMIVIYYLIVT